MSDSVTPELQCIHRAGCPKPNVCREVGHCTSMTASDLTKHREESASAPAGPREKALLTSNQCTKGHLRLFECAGLPEGKYIERRDCLLCEIERLQRERDIWLRGFVREAYPAGPPDLRSHFSDPETRQGITDRDIQAMQAVIDRLYKNRERSLSDEGTQPDETRANPFDATAILANPATLHIDIRFQNRMDYEAALAFLDMADSPEKAAADAMTMRHDKLMSEIGYSPKAPADCLHSWTVLGGLRDPKPEQLCDHGCGVKWADRFAQNGPAESGKP